MIFLYAFVTHETVNQRPKSPVPTSEIRQSYLVLPDVYAIQELCPVNRCCRIDRGSHSLGCHEQMVAGLCLSYPDWMDRFWAASVAALAVAWIMISYESVKVAVAKPVSSLRSE